MSDKKDTGEIVDLTVRTTMWPTRTAPYHQAEYEKGESIEVAPKVADKMEKHGWATREKVKTSGKNSKQTDDLI